MLNKEIAALIKKQRGKTDPLVRSVERGLFIRIHGTGSAAWLHRCRIEGKPTSITLGNYPAMKREEAAGLVAKCRTWLKEGADPRIMLQLDTTRAERWSVREAVTYWLERNKRKAKAQTLASFEMHIFPVVGSTALDSLQSSHWVDILDAIAKGKHTGRPAPCVARALLSDLKAAARVARLMQKSDSRSLDDIPGAFIAEPSTPRKRTLTRDELRDVLRWTIEGKSPAHYRHLTRLLITFGCRTMELRLSHPDEWDLDAGIWTVPEEHSKTRVEIIRPIPDAIRPLVIRLVEEARRTRSGYLLGRLRKQDVISRYLAGLWERMHHQSRWTAHDLRRTFRSELAELGVMPWIGEALLGHQLQGIEATYNRATLTTEKGKALQQWCVELNKIERAGVLTLATMNGD